MSTVLAPELVQRLSDLIDDIEELSGHYSNPLAIAKLLGPIFKEVQELRERLADGEEQT